jgi:Spy/CpxP family protein refolding chaperone
MKTDRRWMAAAVLASLFLSGVAVGGVAVLLIRAPSPPDRSPPTAPVVRGGPRGGAPAPGGLAFVPERTVRRLVEELELTQDQEESVRAILQRQREAARNELTVLAPRLRATVDSAAAQIRRILGDDQRARFDSMDGLSSPGIPPGGPQVP